MTDVVAALIWRGDRFLICRRPMHKARGGLWEFVGGKVEPGESMEQALIRECREELDITVNPEKIYLQVIHHYPDIDIRLTLFHCTVASGTPRLLEHMELAWIGVPEIGSFHFCPADCEILERIRADFSGPAGQIS